MEKWSLMNAACESQSLQQTRGVHHRVPVGGDQLLEFTLGDKDILAALEFPRLHGPAGERRRHVKELLFNLVLDGSCRRAQVLAIVDARDGVQLWGPRGAHGEAQLLIVRL